MTDTPERLGPIPTDRGTRFAVFSSISRWSNHGAWGLAEFYDSRPSEYPKLDTVLQWAKQRGQPVNQLIQR